MHKRITSSMLLVLFLASAMMVSPVVLLSSDAMWIEPEILTFFTNSTTVGDKFNMTAWLNVTSPTNTWAFYLVYNKAHLNAIRGNYTGLGQSLWSGGLPVDTVAMAFGDHNETHNYVGQGEALKNLAEQTGTGSLSWVEFEIMQAPSEGQDLTSKLSLDIAGIFHSYAFDKDFNPIPLTFGSSTYTYMGIHDVAVSDVTLDESFVSQGFSVNITVSVENLGDYAETFNVTLYANTTEIGKQNVTLALSEYKNLTFTWDTSGFAFGNYTVKAVADTVPDETETDNNTYIDNIVEIVPYHDVAITDIACMPPVVLVGDDVSVNITIENQGDYTETDILITVYANTTIIGYEVVTTLTSGSSVIVNHLWNTGNFYGAYTISAYATPVQHEIDTTDNNYTDGTVTIKIHDVAVKSVTPDKNIVTQGLNVIVTVSVENLGDYAEVFNVTLYANTTVIGEQEVALGAYEGTTLNFVWDTSGFALGDYTIKAVADTVPDETETDNNTYIDNIVEIVPYHDVAVTGVLVYGYRRWDTLYVGITIGNEGDYEETISVHLSFTMVIIWSRDSGPVNSQLVVEQEEQITLSPKTLGTVVFSFDSIGTSGLCPMQISANGVPLEWNLDDNSLIFYYWFARPTRGTQARCV